MEVVKKIDKTKIKKKPNEEVEAMHEFYSVKFDKHGNFQRISFKKDKMIELIQKLNFCRYDRTVDEYVYVQTSKNKILTIKNRHQIIDAIEEYIKRLQN